VKRLVLADVPTGAIVRVDGEWGVVCMGRPHAPWARRIVDFWSVGRQPVPKWAVVEMLP